MTPATRAPLPEPESSADWRDDAACLGLPTDAWFPPKDGPTDTAVALRICAGCPVAPACLQDALDHDDAHGIWGGLAPHQRRRIAHTGQPSPRIPS